MAEADGLGGAVAAAASLAHLVRLQRLLELLRRLDQGGAAIEAGAGNDERDTSGRAAIAGELADEVDRDLPRLPPPCGSRWVPKLMAI